MSYNFFAGKSIITAVMRDSNKGHYLNNIYTKSCYKIKWLGIAEKFTMPNRIKIHLIIIKNERVD